MPDAAIRVEGLSKRYRIGEGRSHKTLREALTGAFRAPFRRANRSGHETIWALKDVSFEVAPGEVVGVIGRNGAGKSTLLKILSRITEPTEGRIEIRGRVGSLLEVGTGFHSELTGRENIFLNGAILGMKRVEIERKFDEIVAFAEVEKFIDTPVKHYSSGMYLRLAFAVAAHLEPEILLVDEVLAVGDSEFQKKCLGKMGDVARGGRTVLFVSHNLPAVLSLCGHAHMLEAGRLVQSGPTASVVEGYLRQSISQEAAPLAQRQDRHGTGRVRILSLAVEPVDRQNEVIRCNDSLMVQIAYEATGGLLHPAFVVGFYDFSGAAIFRLDSAVAGGLPETLPPIGTVVCTTDPINLSPGQCTVNVAALEAGILADHIVGAATFAVQPSDYFATGRLFDRQHSILLLRQRWAFGHEVAARDRQP